MLFLELLTCEINDDVEQLCITLKIIKQIQKVIFQKVNVISREFKIISKMQDKAFISRTVCHSSLNLFLTDDFIQKCTVQLYCISCFSSNTTTHDLLNIKCVNISH
jgi:hypothetical protein